MSLVTVVTPTYNRCHTLPRLYESLKEQIDKDFEWLIIDDGSTDDTKKQVQGWIGDNEISVTYLQKNNGGKHTALNYSYPYINSELTFIVDSDDYLTKDALARIRDVNEIYEKESDVCAYSFLRGKAVGGIPCTDKVPEDGLKETYVECRLNRNIGGDMAEVWKTHCLKEFPFPEYPDEKFIGEDLVWIRMSSKYKMRFFNSIIYISEYRDDGLTNNRRQYNIQSPKGCIERAETFLDSAASSKWKIKAMLQYQIYGRFAHYNSRKCFKKCGHKLLFMLCFIPSLLLYTKWKKQF